MTGYDLETAHRIALAREMTAAAGYPLRDRYGFAARDADVLFIVGAVFTEEDDAAAGDLICRANARHAIEIAQACDVIAGEEYEQGIIAALRPLVKDRLEAAARRAEL